VEISKNIFEIISEKKQGILKERRLILFDYFKKSVSRDILKKD